MAVNKNITMEMFMAQNVKMPQDKEFVVSDRITDGEGNPAPWTLHAISGAKDAVLRQECMQGSRFDATRYATLLAAASVKMPDLKNAALQDGYHAQGEADLLEKMLTAAELNALIVQAQIVNGYVKDINELKEQVKNS